MRPVVVLLLAAYAEAPAPPDASDDVDCRPMSIDDTVDLLNALETTTLPPLLAALERPLEGRGRPLLEFGEHAGDAVTVKAERRRRG